jgi:hypothetical protein
MSGPIVRRYGFPNFDKIFGAKELQHGAEATEEKPGTEPSAPTQTPGSPAPETPQVPPSG